MGQIREDLFRLVVHDLIKNNALWDGILSRPLKVLVVPKNKKQLRNFFSSKKSLLS